MAQTRRPTAAHLEQLRRAAKHPLGIVEIDGPRGLAYSARERMMRRLCGMGLLKPYVHGGYEITEAGRAAIDAAEPAIHAGLPMRGA